MSDEVTVETTSTESVTEADADKWKALARKNEARAKENAAAAKERDELKARLDALEAEKLTELERTAKERDEAKAALEAAQAVAKASHLEALKARIGAEKQLPAGLISRLIGDDEESIAADADKLLAELPKADNHIRIGQTSPTAATGQPRADADPLMEAIRNKVGIQ